MKTSRDLMLLATVAFNNGKYDDAGALFAASLSASDADDMVQALNRLGNPKADRLEIESTSSSDKMSLSEIVTSISAAIGDHQSAVAGMEDEAEDEDDEDSNDEELDETGDDDDEDEEDEDDDGDEDGNTTVVSTSSDVRGSKIQRRLKPSGDALVFKTNSPIKLKQ